MVEGRGGKRPTNGSETKSGNMLHVNWLLPVAYFFFQSLHALNSTFIENISSNNEFKSYVNTVTRGYDVFSCAVNTYESYLIS